MIVAVLPPSNDPAPDITPADFNWNEDSASDYAAGDVEIAGASSVTLQATRFRYDGEVVAEKIESGPRDAISTGANLIAAIEYPDSDPTNAIDDGLPSDTDKLTFRYTPSGQVAQRTDQRGITLDFAYGEYDTAVCSGDCPPLSALTGVYVTDADPSNSDVDMSVDQLAFAYDARGQLTKAATLNGGAIKSQVAWVYDSLGNLTSETLDPTDDGNYVKTVNYSWEEATDSQGAGTGQYRLSQIGYPSGLGVEFNYGASGSVSDVVSRVLGYDVGGEALYRNSFTAGGQVTGRSWHDPEASGAQRITQSWIAGSTGGTPSDGMRDQFGRPLHLHYKNGGNTLVHYEYGHDASGNRLFARATQAGHNNDRSFLYRYDELDRLTLAEHGELDSGNDGFVTTSVIPLAKEWKLDILGNWSGGESGLDSVVMFADDDGSLSYDSGSDSNYTTVHHAVNEVNEITGIHVDGGATQPFAYDDAGSLISDNERHFVYDAWNRLVTVTDDATPTPNVLAEYSYDALGRRIRKQVSNSGGWTTSGDGRFYYYDGNRIIEEHADDAAGPGTGPDVVSRFVWGIGYIDEAVAQFTGAGDAQNPHGELQLLITDANYNVAAVVDDSGSLVQQFAYYPYGKRLAVEDSSGGAVNYTSDPSLLATAIGHQGLFHDEEIELIYNRARHLSPELGRFVQRDPRATALLLSEVLTSNARTRALLVRVSSSDQSSNSYLYVNANPFALQDPTGLFSFSDIAAQSFIKGLLMKMLMGGITGAVGNATGAAIFGGDISDAAISGFAGGAAAGLAFASGAGLFAMGAIDGGISGGVNSALAGNSLEQIATDAGSEAIIGGLSAGAIGKLFSWFKGGQVAPPPSQVAPSKAVQRAEQLALNKIAGAAGEALAERQLSSLGYVIRGRQVYARTPLGHRIIDLLVEEPGGRIVAVEVKTGNARRSAIQLAKDASMEVDGTMLVGKNAPADLANEVIHLETIEWHPELHP